MNDGHFSIQECYRIIHSLMRRVQDSYDKGWLSWDEYSRVRDRVNIYVERINKPESSPRKWNEIREMLKEESRQYGLCNMRDMALLLGEEIPEIFLDFFIPVGTIGNYPFYIKHYDKYIGFFCGESQFILQTSMDYLQKFQNWKDYFGTKEYVLSYLENLEFGKIYEMNQDDVENEIHFYEKELIRMRALPMNDLIEEFQTSFQNRRYEMLKILLLSYEEDHFLAHILFDVLKMDSRKEIYRYLPYHLQKLVKMLDIHLEKKVNELSQQVEEISYEKRIAAFRVSHQVKMKMGEKLKELRGSRDTSVKAQQYLDGLLKIPFGVYRQEPIFNFFGTFKNKLYLGIQKMRNEMSSWFPSMISGDLWYYHRLQLILQYWGCDVSLWTENMIETNLQNVLNDLDEITSSPSRSPIEGMPMVEIPDEIMERVIFWEQTWKGWIDEWQCFSVKKSEYMQYVRNRLSKCIYGQEKTKKQIERLLAQGIHGRMDGLVFGFQGPPGVGKTSLAKKGFASCFQDENGEPRPIGFIPLGGATHGSYLDGHHYTYMGSTWGRIVDILIESQCMNPIIYIDELDKVSQTEQGREIIGILTHATDPSQNHDFYDRYFAGIPLDLSKVIFIFSYNDGTVLDKILRDRITEIQVYPLSVNEKINIIQDYSLPEILDVVGYKKGEILLSQDVIDNLIQEYTQEAGVRKLHEKVFEIVREVNLQRTLDPSSIIFPLHITWEWIQNFYEDLPRKKITKIHTVPKIGFVNGLYATPTGIGGLSIIQCVKIPSDTKLHLELTGQQGEVMRESMMCAKTLAWSLMSYEEKKLVHEEWEKIGLYGLHVHCPEASTPKDGPSAGGAITIAMLSCLSSRKVRNDVALMGEIDLHGNIYPVGSVDVKLLGAHRAGVKRIFMPEGNRAEVLRMRNDEWLNEMEIIYMSQLGDILNEVLI